MLNKEIEEVFRENITPKSVYAVYDCHVSSGAVTLGVMSVKSKSLASHLKSCNRAVLLAATLGTNADMLIRRYSVQDMEKVLITVNICADMIEAYLDKTEKEISILDDLKGLFAVDRYSPGYGDFCITCQKDILKLIGASRIGLSLTDGFILTPSKSVTTVIGFFDEQQNSPRLINNHAASSGVCCSNKVLHSGFNTIISAPRGGVLNPSARIQKTSKCLLCRDKNCGFRKEKNEYKRQTW